MEVIGIHGIDEVSILNAKLDALRRRMDEMHVIIVLIKAMSCKLCGGGHSYMECQLGGVAI
ncbi:conserved hypothetical protein [Ricinus communis]|uniref:Uncharacterized protein n=1 Tax=Ricinus communis TaxID=3988 RepID=B9SA69_RICCO|nr:conserved hypothetical protein [Ricinus communis]